MRNIMLDIETLGTRGTSVVLSIGAVAFDDTALGQTFHVRVDIDSCLQAGLTVDGRTIQWWMDQPDEARELFQADAVPLEQALRDFSAAFDWDDVLVWCNGMNFDLPILENAFNAVGIPVPWKYYNGRDYRTLKGMFSKDLVNRVRVEPVVAHDALADATAQALTLQALLDVQRIREAA